MAKNIHVGFILDETGSMQAVKAQTISGFNEYISSLKKNQNGNRTLFTLAKFNSEKYQLVYEDSGIEWVSELDEKNYQPNWNTPLYDAVGRTILALDNRLKKKKRQNVLFVIQTDGQENASLEYSRDTIFQMIQDRKEKGWTFVFLGADQDAYVASQMIGISRGNTLSYSSHDTKQVFGRGMASATCCYTNTGGKQTENLWAESKAYSTDEEEEKVKVTSTSKP